MSKPMTKARLAQLKSYSDPDTLDGARVLELIGEVERLQKLAKPNRKTKTRKVSSYVKNVWDAQDKSETVNDNCSRNAKGCRCRITENACKAFDYYDGRLG